MSDGTFIRVDHLTREPGQINSVLKIVGPDACYVVNCKIAAGANVHGVTDPNCIVANRSGECLIQLKDGTQYQFFYPSLMFHGYLKQTRMAQFFNKKNAFSGVKDLTNNLTCTFELSKPDRSWTGWASGMVFGKKANQDVFKQCLVVHKITDDQNSKEISSGFTNYTSLSVWDEKVYWRFTDNLEKWSIEGNDINLDPENCIILREDLELIKLRKYSDVDKFINNLDKESKAK